MIRFKLKRSLKTVGAVWKTLTGDSSDGSSGPIPRKDRQGTLNPEEFSAYLRETRWPRFRLHSLALGRRLEVCYGSNRS